MGGEGGVCVCVCGWLEKDGEHEVRTLWTSCEADISTLPFYDVFFLNVARLLVVFRLRP